MKPVIGMSCSTLVLTGMRGVPRHALSEMYVACVNDAGGLPFMLPNVAPDYAAAYLSRIDGLLMSGGLDVDPMFYDQEPRREMGKMDRVRDIFELALMRGAIEAGIPILAICRGIQVLNVACGGTLIQDIPSQVEGAIKHEQDALRQDAVGHAVDIEAGSKLAEIVGNTRVRVNSFHHQAVDRVAEGFVVTARTADGVIEGIEDPKHPYCVGVQWHPERLPAETSTQNLFSSFVEAARAAAQAGTRSDG